MGFLDRLLGRSKKDAGEMTGDSSLQSEGEHQEGMAAAEEHAEAAGETAQAEGAEAAANEAEQKADS